jgi:hypothetical protein
MHTQILLGEYIVKTTFEYWLAACYPSLYLARGL